MRKPPSSSEVRRCQYHCSGCGCHFTSLQAFDDHRTGDWSERACWGEDAEERLEIVREDGICDLWSDPPRIGVCLWRRKRAVSLASPSLAPSDDPDGDLAA